MLKVVAPDMTFAHVSVRCRIVLGTIHWSAAYCCRTLGFYCWQKVAFILNRPRNIKSETGKNYRSVSTNYGCLWHNKSHSQFFIEHFSFTKIANSMTKTCQFAVRYIFNNILMSEVTVAVTTEMIYLSASTYFCHFLFIFLYSLFEFCTEKIVFLSEFHTIYEYLDWKMADENGLKEFK